MKFGFPGALLACVFLGNSLAAEATPPMQAATAQKEASLWVARIVERYRYKPEGQPNGSGVRPFDRFLAALDTEHMLFTQADLDSMENYRTSLDKLTDEKQMEIPNAIFTTFQARSEALHAYAMKVLRQPLDFKGHERFQRVRSNAGWAADETALRDLWRRRVMEDYLNLRLAAKSEAQIIPTLQDRYDSYLQRLQALRSDDIANLFLNAYVESLDPHGSYLGPATTADDLKRRDMVGIGLVLQKKDDLIYVKESVAGSVANLGAISAGDRIVGVAKGPGSPMTDVIGWRVNEVVELLRGVPGSQVELDILPQSAARDNAPRRVSITRPRVEVDQLRARARIERIEQGGIVRRIGVIAVPAFYQDFEGRKAGAKDYTSVTRDVAAALEQMKLQKADAILLDMRNNGGGSLIEAVDLTGLFLPGVPVVQQLSYDHKLTVETAPRGTPAWEGPLAILIGRASAAATEIAAAALQDYGRGLVIGDVSFGRGSIQTVLNLNRFSRNSARQLGDLRLTIAVLCRVNGKPIQRSGVTPDILVPGRIDATGKANADLYAGESCKVQDIPRSAELDPLLPELADLHARRMKANPRYQALLARRAQDEALLSSDEASLNEAERRRALLAQPDGDIVQAQLAEALRVVSDIVELRTRPGKAGGM